VGAEQVVSIIALVVGGVIVSGLVLRYRKRELQHKERLAALDKGMALPELSGEGRVWSPRVYLLRGMLWLFGGVALTAFIGAFSVSTGGPMRLEDRIWRARNLKNMGATEEEIKQAENDLTPQDKLPGAVALLGLVPIGVGLAYLIFYRVESKSSGVVAVRRESSL
jgi:hypothetical protein